MSEEPWGLPRHFADCYSRHPSESELFIVGSTEFDRLTRESCDRRIQAVMRLEDDVTGQGDLNKVLDSVSNASILAALGAGVAIHYPGLPFNPETCRLDKLRYAKIFVVTDDSAEGRKIKKGILKFMVRTLWPVVDAGHVYLPTFPISPDISPHEFVERVIDPETRQFVQYKLPS